MAPVLYDGKLVDPQMKGPTVVLEVLAAAAAAGQNLLRINAFSVDYQYAVLSQQVRLLNLRLQLL